MDCTVGRRPSDRKARILDAAAALFAQRGYHNVSMAEIAALTGITASALYRHFRGKQDLLLRVVLGGVEFGVALIRETDDLDAYLAAMPAVCARMGPVAVLWQREARHLADDQRAVLCSALEASEVQLMAMLCRARPSLPDVDAELIAWALLSVYGSSSWRSRAVSRRRFSELLTAVGHAVAWSELGEATAEVDSAARGPAQPRPAASRREQLLVEAIALFDRHGYQSVGVDDIGAAVGIAGPSVYNHFASKTDLLVVAAHRGVERMQAGVDRAVCSGAPPEQTVELLLRTHIDFALRDSRLIGVLLSDIDQLPDPERRAVAQADRGVLNTWIGALQATDPGLSAAEAKIRARSAMGLVNNLVRTPATRRHPDLANRLVAIGAAVLRAR
ncbi:TetR/AcrR family transcriptional regulator [Streptomyces sp. NPDC057580]|uniref:TetR/AcrR family transcriptional regulator n=1 Tax=Streptomyces sp. NPDC057580 TaxID=3346173 RepID=UPI00367C98D0